MPTVHLTAGSLHETCRALADRGQDYGWNTYYRGIPTQRNARAILEQDGADWLAAMIAATSAYRAATGHTWRY